MGLIKRRAVPAHYLAHASLILRDYLVVPWAYGKRTNLDEAKALADDFTARLTAAAIKGAQTSDDNCVPLMPIASA